MQVTLHEVVQITPDTYSFWFVPEQPMRYQAGQFIELTLQHEDADTRGIRRWFTLSSSPTEPRLAITTKLPVAGTSSYKNFLYQMRPGSHAAMSSPMGDFVLPRNVQAPIVFIAGGIGITPFRSMVRWLIDNGEQRRVYLLYGAESLEHFAFRDELESYNLSSKYQVGLHSITSSSVLELIRPLVKPLVYIAGPEPMVEMLVANLQADGVPQRQLVTDYFSGYEV